jgi:hypothetical protein
MERSVFRDKTAGSPFPASSTEYKGDLAQGNKRWF